MHCTVLILGHDRKTHTLEVEATSLFAIVDQAVQQWALLWWYGDATHAEVRAGKRHWRVSLERVRVWRGTRATPKG